MLASLSTSSFILNVEYDFIQCEYVIFSLENVLFKTSIALISDHVIGNELFLYILKFEIIVVSHDHD